MSIDARRFTNKQRIALYLAQEGRCALCNAELVPGWHADHVQAWSRGGSTDVVNGQALCPACNLKKGTRGYSMEFREWQKQAHRQYIVDALVNWLLYVTPAGGKTKWALSVASALLHDKVIDRVVIVVPTDYIRTQWIRQGGAFGVHLAFVTNGDGGFENRVDYQGIVVTYSQVAHDPDLYRQGCGRYATLVIFDECHHAGDSQSWGQSVEHAFEPAARRISMTGTPWRAPKHGKIPFVIYDEKGKVTPNYSYSYKKGVRDGICRPIQFHAFDGEVTYVNIDSCAPQVEVLRLGEVEEDENSKVLRDILRAEGKWMASILREADCALLAIRRGEDEEDAIPDAKGLVIVHDRIEARAVVKLLERITGERPALVISDPEPGEPNPQEELERFRKGLVRWVVAVDMITEGVDIPALYVGVYATRKKTPLRFQQIVGRFIRQRPNDTRAAVLFIPAVPSILALAAAIEDELLHVMEEEDDDNDDGKERTPRYPKEPPTLDTLFRGTSEAEFYGVISEGTSYTGSELQQVVQYCQKYKIPQKYTVEIANLLRTLGMAEPKASTQPPPKPEQEQEKETMPRQEEQRMLSQLLDKEIGRLAGFIAERDGIDIGQAKREWNTRLKSFYGQSRKKMSIATLRDALTYIKEIRYGMTGYE